MTTEIRRPWMQATPAGGTKPRNLRDWMRKELIKVESTKSYAFDSAYLCWQGKRSAIDHWDVYGDNGFAFGDTAQQAFDNFCVKADITVPEEFRGQAVSP